MVGERLYQCINDFLGERKNLKNVSNILDFASGYGRLTRYLVSDLNRSNVSIAEIDHNAVDFLTNLFNIEGYKTTERSKNLVINKKFDFIIVISLFSHLSIDYWDLWLDKLCRGSLSHTQKGSQSRTQPKLTK